ncbi:monovalent cation/H+ antiporter subunit A [Cnuibacter physcomitrellae]|uniref:Na+/H+ antiporter subunit A n=1 Tax=Cnuibacter physcomitrellae TaxID=1619308 RepID=A0A1X9LP26_9MICO|nr:Na+/H+ antiporter subunit A [Cnuibacter physcomitrellae]ARJ06964.1 Na+/H+ antiporter subunit A [Cnuibacter physcomitrellae]GGI39232.1 monovalent cation/H+ antiporter subunit A [Cnuibacter physcomitrellae]
MIALLLLFAVIGALTPALTRVLSTRVFYVAALVPAAAFVFTLTQTEAVLADRPPTELVPWIPQLDVAFSFRVDTLSWVMALIVTGIGALVLVYSARYFSRDEPSLGRIAALLLLFAGTMYGLVTADDVYVMFMFWEITSILSYLLIGHYTNRRESRGAALQALLVTTFGGLAMLVGLVLLQVETGTSSISAIVDSHPEGALTTVAVMLVLAGALSKSALVPFHFWLPAAMAAPTPVSAYLHAAAMVKAGVYLVLLLAPGFADTPGWVPVLVILGSLTMLVGAWRSLKQNDLKLLLAYGTVSQLGFLMVVAGFGTRDAALAGLALVIAHALFKSTLFLVVGIVDHDEGTRDLRALSGLGRRRPVLATIAIVAALSMAGIPPLVGFVAKEAAFTSFIEAAIMGDGWGWVAIIATGLGSVLTVAYTARFVWGTFGRKPTPTTTTATASTPTAAAHPHAPSRGILVAPAVLALASIAGGLLAKPLLDVALATYADDAGEGDYHLALWHGLEAALFVSAAVIVLGLLMFRWRARVRDVQSVLHLPLDAGRAYWHVLSTIDHVAARVTMFAQKGGLAQYLGTILVVFVLSLGTVTAISRQWPDTFVLWDYPAQVFVAAAMAIAAVMAARAQQRLAAVLLVGSTGYGLVVLFAMHGAPDLALTQALVETVTIVVFVLVLRRLPRRIAQHNKPKHKKRRALIGIAFGATVAVVGWVALGAREAGGLGPELARLALLEGHGQNVVNVMLVDIRAWDTMNELSVLVVVATGVASLLFVSGRHELVPRLRESRDRRRAANRQKLVDDPHTPTAPAENDRQHTWLLGGRTLAPRDRSLVLEVIVRLVFHPAILVSIYLLFVGHNAPGGGFAAGMLAGLALIVRYLAGGRYELGEAAPIGPGPLLGAGILLATGTALASLFLGADVLTSAYWSAEVPVLGYVSFGTSTIFDIGVYLVVIGVVLDVLRSLGGEVDRQLAEDDEVSGAPDAHTVSEEQAETQAAQAEGHPEAPASAGGGAR